MTPYSGTISQTVQRYGFGRDTIYRLINEGKVSSFTVGRRRLVNFESVDRYLGSLQGGKAAA